MKKYICDKCQSELNAGSFDSAYQVQLRDMRRPATDAKYYHLCPGCLSILTKWFVGEKSEDTGN